MGLQFSEVITTEAQLSEVIGIPNHRVLKKQISSLDDHCRVDDGEPPLVYRRPRHSSDPRGSSTTGRNR
jgi:hypothetical protein